MQVATIYTGVQGYLDDLAVGDVRKFLEGLRAYIKSNKQQFATDVASSKKMSPESEEILKAAITEYKAIFKAS